jgi:hypothetical protein
LGRNQSIFKTKISFESIKINRAYFETNGCYETVKYIKKYSKIMLDIENYDIIHIVLIKVFYKN